MIKNCSIYVVYIYDPDDLETLFYLRRMHDPDVLETLYYLRRMYDPS